MKFVCLNSVSICSKISHKTSLKCSHLRYIYQNSDQYCQHSDQILPKLSSICPKLKFYDILGACSVDGGCTKIAPACRENEGGQGVGTLLRVCSAILQNFLITQEGVDLSSLLLAHFNRKACTKIKYYSQNSTGGESEILFPIM